MTLVKQPPDDAMVLWFVVSPLREGALVQYSSLFCAIFNYAALHPILRTLALGAARDAAAAHFALRHRDQIHNLLIDARRFFHSWGREAIEQWSLETNGYAGEAEQMAVRARRPKQLGAKRLKSFGSASTFWGPRCCRDTKDK